MQDSHLVNSINRSLSDTPTSKSLTQPQSNPVSRYSTGNNSHAKASENSVVVALPEIALVPVSSITRLNFFGELLQSTEHIFFQNRLTMLMTLGPLAIVGDSFGFLGEELSFMMAGIALIPCAERCVQKNPNASA
jgi:hypothetical protein